MTDLQLIALRKEIEILRADNLNLVNALESENIVIQGLRAELAHYKDEWRVAKEYVTKRCGSKGSTSILRLALRQMWEENDQLRQTIANLENKLAVRGYEIQIEDLKAELAHIKENYTLCEKEPYGWWHQGLTEDESEYFETESEAGKDCSHCVPLYRKAAK